LRPNDEQRRRLAAKANLLKRRVLDLIAGIMTPLRPGGQATALVLVEGQASPTKLLAKNTVLLAQITDPLELALVHFNPPGDVINRKRNGSKTLACGQTQLWRAAPAAESGIFRDGNRSGFRTILDKENSASAAAAVADYVSSICRVSFTDGAASLTQSQFRHHCCTKLSGAPR
jgi:hypothetical protein